MLVVGASHSGSDIAYEVAATHDVVLSGRNRLRPNPTSIANRPRFQFSEGDFWAQGINVGLDIQF